MQLLRNMGSVYCGTRVWDTLNTYLDKNNHSRVFIVTDSNTRVHCLPKLLEAVSFENPPYILEIPAGERYKTINSCIKLWNELSEQNADRDGLIINLGGGVVTDLGGFVACTFKRGIDFLNIPTSLLSMVDASIGGKTGVDLGTLKNQVGVIREPSLVLLDVSFLDTLPVDHLRSGLAEMLKHGIIASEAYFDACLGFMVNSDSTEDLIWESVLIKHSIVSEDPMEKGKRKLLNFGHTLGHAIESHYLQKQSEAPLLHGEAIAIGMILASFISSEQLGFPKESLQKISTGIAKLYPKQSFSDRDIEAICELLIYDKKNSGGRINFVLLKDFADHKINCEVPNSLILKAFNYYSSLD